MNFYETLNEMLKVAEWPEEHDALANALLDVVEAYERLKPTAKQWKKAPAWAGFFAINPTGTCFWLQKNPYVHTGLLEWACSGWIEDAAAVELPENIDWRCCCWERPVEEETA